MAKRDPLHDPQPGDRFHHATFAGGCTFTVCRRAFRAGGDWRTPGQRYEYVAMRLERDDGQRIDQRGRCYPVASLRDWKGLEPLPK